MARDEEYDYESSSAPATPLSSGNEGKKKRNPLKKLISFTTKKSPNDLDKSERGSKDDGGSPSRSKRFNIFKRHRTQKYEDDVLPAKKDEQPKPENNEKTQNLSQINKGLQEDRPKTEVLKVETKPHKHNLLTETLGEVLKLSGKGKGDGQNHPHKQTQLDNDNKGKPKQHQELNVVAKEAHEKGVVKHDQHSHHEEAKDHKDDAKQEKSMATSEAAKEQGEDLGPPPALGVEEGNVGCESLAQGLQKVCLPWTINKEDH